MKPDDPFIELPGHHEMADLPRDLVKSNIPESALVEEFGVWTPTVHLLRRLGAKDVYLMGEGVGAQFEKFALETQVYQTKTVAAMNSTTKFILSDAVVEKMAFVIFLTKADPRAAHTQDISCGPIPECARDLMPVVLARNYACALGAMLAKHPHLIGLPPKTDAMHIESTLLRLVE